MLTHTYSHTKLVASFAGFAPVSSPAISVAVVIDTPTAGGEVSHYGGATSAPVFAEVAQQVLEYLGVPHDQPLTTKKKEPVVLEADSASSPLDAEGLSAMFSEVNNLPADDPLRAAANNGPGVVAKSAASVVAEDVEPVEVYRPHPPLPSRSGSVLNLLPDKVLTAFKASGGTSSTMPDAWAGLTEPLRAALVTSAPVRGRGKGTVVVDSTRRVEVPSFNGVGLRTALEAAASVGLRVEPVGKWVGTGAGTGGGDDGSSRD